MRGKIELFGLDTLVNMAVAVGLHVEMHISAAENTTTIEASGANLMALTLGSDEAANEGQDKGR